LTRSFLVAGARTVVARWWDVEDQASRRFMELFYEGLREGWDRDVAAQKAGSRMADEGYNPLDRLAFAVVGAVSGSMVDVLAEPGGDMNKVPLWWGLFVILVGLVVWLAIGRRRHTSA
jgi:CHAT domain-containing protein